MHAIKAMDALRRIVRGLRETHLSARGNAITMAQLFVLRQIAGTQALSLSEIAVQTMTSPSWASEVTNQLVTAQLVDRSVVPTDHRRVEFRVTAKGARALAGSPSSVQERLLTGFRLLSEGEQRDLSRTLDAWVSASGLPSVPGEMFFEETDERKLVVRTSTRTWG
jgi:DNA-binding MarR family transcriptional regulator